MPNAQPSKYQLIRGLLDSAGSRFVMITFHKKDGSLRKMSVQPAAAKYRVKGEAASEQGKKAAATRSERYPNLLNVWDTDRKAFRSINMDTVTRVSCNGQEYTFDSQ